MKPTTAGLLFILIATQRVVCANFNDANWVSLSAFPGADGTVYAMVTNASSGVLYIGGSFNVVGTTVAASVAQWDGTNWSSLGSSVGGSVRALALDSTGNLYAGGAFTNAALQATNIAKWNGTSWSPLGNGVTRQVLSLAVDNSGTVYAGGAFTNTSLSATNLVRWNGSSWSGAGLEMNGNVSALGPWERKHVRGFVFLAEAPVQFLETEVPGDQDVHVAGDACHFLRPPGEALEFLLTDILHGCFKYDHALLKQIGRALIALPLKILLDSYCWSGGSGGPCSSCTSRGISSDICWLRDRSS